MPTKFDPDKHHRRSIRLKHYDYSAPGNYFVTICLQNRACLLGKIVAGHMQLNDAGRMVQQSWIDLPNRFFKITLDTFVVMPNHFHSIITLNNNPVGAPLVGALDNLCDNPTSPSKPFYNNIADGGSTLDDNDRKADTRPAPTEKITLGHIVGAFKSITTHGYITGVHHQVWEPFHQRLWQRNYYEHIIRNDESLQYLRQYIALNPKTWKTDQLHPDLASP